MKSEVSIARPSFAGGAVSHAPAPGRDVSSTWAGNVGSSWAPEASKDWRKEASSMLDSCFCEIGVEPPAGLTRGASKNNKKY